MTIPRTETLRRSPLTLVALALVMGLAACAAVPPGPDPTDIAPGIAGPDNR